MLIIAACLVFLTGIIHSSLGEKYILIRLFRRDNIPHLFGDDTFTKGTLRFVWHIITVAWWGYGVILLLLSGSTDNLRNSILVTVAAVFFVSGIFSAGFTKGKHLSWVAFFLIAGLSICVAAGG